MEAFEQEADDDFAPLLAPPAVAPVIADEANAVPAAGPGIAHLAVGAVPGGNAVGAVPGGNAVGAVPGGNAVGPVPPVAQRRVDAQKIVSKMRTDIIISANGDEWVKHMLSRNGAKQYWRCREHHTCAMRGVSDFGSTIITRTQPDARHTHDQSPATQLARNLQGAVRDKAIQDRDASNAAIVDNILRGQPNDVAQRLRRTNLIRVANNAKRGHGADHVNCPIDAMEFIEAYSTTAAGEEFLLFDSRQTEPDQPPIVIFASATGIQELRRSRDWGSDGTFHVAPPQFDSLYTVHAMRDDHSAVCAAYILLPDRTFDTYLRALRALIREANLDDAAPMSIMTDFEAAAIKAWRTIFPTAHMRGCLFHFSQALWRNIASKGLTLLYRGNNKARELLRCFAALAFVHPNDVHNAYDAVIGALQESLNAGEIDAGFEAGVNSFCDYVRDNYLRRLDRQGRWQAPRVADVASWNCHFATLQGFHRTNNTIEAWNRQFGELFPRAHCVMDKFIYRMQTDEDRSRQALQRLELYPNEPLRRGRRPQHVATDAALRGLVERYAEYVGAGRLLDFMRAVQHHLYKAKFPGEAPAEGEADNAGAGPAVQDNEDGEPPNDAPILAPALPDVAPPMQAVNQPVQAPPVRAQPAVAQPAVAPPVRAQPAVAPPVRAQTAVAPAQAGVAELGRALVATHARAPVPFELPRRIIVEVRRSANNEPVTVQGHAQDVAVLQMPGPSHTATPLRTLASAAALQRRVINARNQEPGAATAGPSATRKRPSGAAPLAAPPKNQAMHREAPRDDDQQQEEVQLPSQLSQNATTLQPLGAIDNTSGFVAGRRAGRGSRIADFIRRLS